MPPVRGLSSISFSADSRRLLLGREDGVVQAYPLRSLGILKASTVGIWGLQFSPTGKHLLLADYNGNLQLRLAKGLSSPAVELRLSEVALSNRSSRPMVYGWRSLLLPKSMRFTYGIWLQKPASQLRQRLLWL